MLNMKKNRTQTRRQEMQLGKLLIPSSDQHHYGQNDSLRKTNVIISHLHYYNLLLISLSVGYLRLLHELHNQLIFWVIKVKH